MNLLEQTQQLCRLYNIHPARSKGQNFLIKEEVHGKIVEAAELKSDDVVLEVGPGLGFLTTKLAERVKKVIAVELDDKLAEALRLGLTARGVKNVEVVNEDIIQFSIFNFQFSNNFKIKNSKFKIVANLPYNISSVFLRKFLSAEVKPELMALMLQKEVAERITAKPGRMSLLSVSVQLYAQAEIIEIVPADNFWPKPEVNSAIVKLMVKSEKLKVNLGVDKEREFFRLVKFGFSAKRKMLKNNLAAGLKIGQKIIEHKLKSCGFNPKIRAQELAVADWLKLFGELAENMV